MESAAQPSTDSLGEEYVHFLGIYAFFIIIDEAMSMQLQALVHNKYLYNSRASNKVSSSSCLLLFEKAERVGAAQSGEERASG